MIHSACASKVLDLISNFSSKAVKTRPRNFILSKKVHFEEKENHDDFPAVLTD